MGDLNDSDKLDQAGQVRAASIHVAALGTQAREALERIDSQPVLDFWVSAAVEHFAALPDSEQHKRWLELALAERERLLKERMAPDLDALPAEERKAAEEKIRAMMTRYRQELEVYESKFE